MIVGISVLKQFRAYYDLYAEEDNVKVFEKGGVCDSGFDKDDADLAWAGGMEAMKGTTTWSTALDWIIFPYLDNNGLLKP